MDTPGMWASLFAGKCPQCRRHSVFSYKTYDLYRFLIMPKNCPKCNLRFELQPGFFFGAMYISYAISVALFVSLFVAMYILFHPIPSWIYFSVVIGLIFLISPLNFRFSRLIWLYIFVRYRPAEEELD